MNLQQEEKLNAVHDLALIINERLELMNERINTNRTNLIEHEKEFFEIKKDVAQIQADSNKAKGAIWVFVSGFAAAVLAFIVSLFK